MKRPRNVEQIVAQLLANPDNTTMMLLWFGKDRRAPTHMCSNSVASKPRAGRPGREADAGETRSTVVESSTDRQSWSLASAYIRVVYLPRILQSDVAGPTRT
jgi:hypothetical protein